MLEFAVVFYIALLIWKGIRIGKLWKKYQKSLKKKYDSITGDH